MKKFMCQLLIVWLALMSGTTSAHATYEAAHGAEHAAQSNVVNSDTLSHADHADACNQSHCGHGHGTGMVASLTTCIKMDAAADAPLSSSCWASAAITDNIERPKWLFTTPTVVSLLS